MENHIKNLVESSGKAKTPILLQFVLVVKYGVLNQVQKQDHSKKQIKIDERKGYLNLPYQKHKNSKQKPSSAKPHTIITKQSFF